MTEAKKLLKLLRLRYGITGDSIQIMDKLDELIGHRYDDENCDCSVCQKKPVFCGIRVPEI